MSSPLPRIDLSRFPEHQVPGFFDQLLKRSRIAVDDFAARYRERFPISDPVGVARVLSEYESCLRPLLQASSYLDIRSGLDSADDTMTLSGRCDRLWEHAVEQLGFVEQNLAEAHALDASDAALADYRSFLDQVRATSGEASTGPSPAADPSASEVIERLDPVATSGWRQLSRQLLDRILVSVDGAEVSIGEALPNLYVADSSRRTRVSESISDALQPDLELRVTALSMTIRADTISRRVRRDTDWLSSNAHGGLLEDAEVAALRTAVAANRDIVHEYYRAKARMLSLELTDADRYAPVGASPRVITWGEACDVVVDAFTGIAPELGARAKDVLAHGAVDAAPRPGKRRGPHTVSLPGGRSYVLVNFTGRLRDVFVLGHELGHALHSGLAGHRGMLSATPSSVLAETSALFAETVVGEQLGARPDPGDRTVLLARRIEDQLVAVFRHAAILDFEEDLHKATEAGHVLDAAEIGRRWLSHQSATYGPAVRLTAGYSRWWSYLDSVYLTPGAALSYVYGQLAALALGAARRDDPERFGRRWCDVLALGGARRPGQTLRAVGVETTDPACWATTLCALRALVADFGAMDGPTNSRT